MYQFTVNVKDVFEPIMVKHIRPFEALLADSAISSEEIRTIWTGMANGLMVFFNEARQAEKAGQDQIKIQYRSFVEAGATVEEQALLIQQAKALYSQIEERYELIKIRREELFHLVRSKMERKKLEEGARWSNPWDYERPQAARSSSSSSSGSRSGYAPPRPAPKVGALEIFNGLLKEAGLPPVSSISSPEEKKTAYRKACMKFHPDMGGNLEKMKALNGAWEVVQK